MELRQLRYFLSAARHRSFTEAARECCVVQSAMSQQIKALEKELDVTLFERTKHGLKLTHEGQTLEQEATALLQQATQLHTAVAQAKTRGMCLLRVGCQGSLMYSALPQALAALHKENPLTRVWIRCGLREQLLTGLRERAIDCALMLWEDADANNVLQTCLVLEDRLCAAIPAASPLAEQETVTLDDVIQEPLFLCASEVDRRLLNDHLAAYIDESKPVFVESQIAAEVLVAAGFGVSLCVQSAARPHPNIVYRVLHEAPTLRICLVWSKDHPLEELTKKLASQLLIAPSEKISVF